jgi:arylsulfatase
MTLRPLATLLALLTACAGSAPPPSVAVERPNLLLVVADDLGFSDTGPYGSEIRTPTLDALSQTGMIATNFYVAPRGSPTRAMLLTGVDHHRAGFGGGRGQGLDAPGYEGRFNQRVVCVASLLREAGYHTYMAGKWELGEEPEDRPAARGFERSFALLDDAASHWGDMKTTTAGRERAHYRLNGERLETLPGDHFSTRAFTDFLIESIDANREDDHGAQAAWPGS